MQRSPNPSRRQSRLAVQILAIALTLTVSLPASAEWLITHDGHRIETDGPWKVKGRLVVYTDAKGTLSSIRLDEIDLEASETASQEPAEEPAESREDESKPEREPRKRPVLVLTDGDIPEATTDGPAAEIEPERPELIMYSTDWCGVCRRARTLLAELDADYVEKDIEKSTEAQREYVAKFGSSGGVPAFDYDGESFTGLRPDILREWVVEMKGADSTRR